MKKSDITRARNFLPNNEPRYVRCYDNTGLPEETADCYTVIFTGRYRHLTGGETQVLSMSGAPFHPQGVGLHGGYMNIPDVGPNGQWPPAIGRKCHLGKRIRFADLPADCRRLTLADYIQLWDIKAAHLCVNGHCPSIETRYYEEDATSGGVWACEKHRPEESKIHCEFCQDDLPTADDRFSVPAGLGYMIACETCHARSRD